MVPWAWLLAGCAVEASGDLRVQTAAQVRAEPSSASSGRVALSRAPTPAHGVRPMEGPCEEVDEVACSSDLDACPDPDDDGCEANRPSIRITLLWETGADLNLRVIDPKGESIHAARDRSGSGAFFDRTARGGCAPASEGPPYVESVRWSQKPPSGTYRVEVHYWGECGSGAGPTPIRLAIAVEGAVHRFEHTMLPSERMTVATFDIHQP
jgi:hypothetical protein